MSGLVLVGVLTEYFSPFDCAGVAVSYLCLVLYISFKMSHKRFKLSNIMLFRISILLETSLVGMVSVWPRCLIR